MTIRGERRDSAKNRHCCFLKRMQRYVENKENPLRFVSLVSNRECNDTKRTKGLSLDLLLSFLKENAWWADVAELAVCLSYTTTNPTQLNMESLECHCLLHMKPLLDVAENSKHHKKKKLDEESVVHDASMLLGLSYALKNLANADILVLRDNPYINYKSKMDLTKHLVAKFMEKTPETSTGDLASEHQQPHSPSITITSPRTSSVSKDIYSSFSHLASSFVEVQKVIEKEREINRCLLIENAKFISQLGDSTATVESPSRCECYSNLNNEAIQNKQSLIVFEDIRSKTTIEIAENRTKTNRKGKSKKKTSKSSQKEISTSSDTATETVNSSASASTSRKDSLRKARKTQMIIISNPMLDQIRLMCY